MDGETLVWRDILCEGPAAPAIDAPAERAAYLTRYLEIGPGQYVDGWHDAHTVLAAAGNHDEIVLWFEQDLFCAVNLWYVLTHLRDGAAVSLVYPSLDDVRGLGASEPACLAALFDARRPLSADAVERGRTAWRAYASATPAEAQALVHSGDGSLPFVADALRRHLARLPALASGLNEIEEAALHEMESGPRPFPAVFSAVTAREPLRRHGMGDVQLAATLRALAGSDPPLVTIEGGAVATCRHWQVQITAAGGAALQGDPPWQPPARWIGGIHVDDTTANWRRDGDIIRKVV